jgi:hypothetical protein
MTKDAANYSGSNITRLMDNLNYQPQGVCAANDGSWMDGPLGALECVFASVRFWRPANDSSYASKPLSEQPAPIQTECRQARLIRLWVETLADLDRESA